MAARIAREEEVAVSAAVDSASPEVPATEVLPTVPLAEALPAEVVAASWDSVIFDIGRESLVRVPMMEPERGTKKHVGALFDRCASAKDLLEALTSG